jgi:hypothetical protein
MYKQVIECCGEKTRLLKGDRKCVCVVGGGEMFGEGGLEGFSLHCWHLSTVLKGLCEWAIDILSKTTSGKNKSEVGVYLVNMN